MSGHATLSAATQDRKARLAQLKSLKRKVSDTTHEDDAQHEDLEVKKSANSESQGLREASQANISTDKYLSGRNFDISTRGPKLGFETAPSAGQETVEIQATRIVAQVTLEQQREQEAQDKPLDLFKLQPKKPNWDLKRDLNRKLEILNVRTDNAIARLVRERIERAKQEEQAHGADGDAVGIEGNALLKSTREMEREQRQEAEAAAREDLDA